MWLVYKEGIFFLYERRGHALKIVEDFWSRPEDFRKPSKASRKLLEMIHHRNKEIFRYEFRKVIESYLTDFGFHGVGLNYSGLLYQILRQRCSIFFKMANLWQMNYSEFKLILLIKTDFVAWTAFAKKQYGQKLASSTLSHLSLKVLSSFIRNHQFLYFRGTSRFPALGTDRPFFRAWHRLSTCFPVLWTVHQMLLGH